ncbi:MAG: type II toxin-antitoxin system RelE/ParE family toxin [Clostridia bacterium]|nr:type II toxin-antitoxin system RelE/ParE family toxin [Clostridia bacterium]
MEKYKIVFLPSAEKELNAICEHVSLVLCAPTASNNFLIKLTECVENLVDFPFTGKKVEAPNLEFEFRRVLVDNYFVFYVVNEKLKTVTIMHVIYAKSDYLKNL